ncbi:MAG: NAD(P)H-dependent flavin oxidoreductase [Candidatus Helarchaeota archaeon]
MLKTRMTEIFGCKYPIMLAGMGPFSTYKTAVHVGNAGGIGLCSHWGILSKVDPKTHLISDGPNARVITPAEKIKHDMEYIAEHAEDGAVFGANIRVARIQVDAPRVIRTVLKMREKNPKLKECVKLIVTSAGNPVPANKIIKKKDPNMLHLHVSPSLKLCDVTLQKAGCDGVIAVGIEGGGHQSYEQVATSVLIPEVREKYPDALIIAGGGFATGRTLASALALGADGVQMGSRFIATSDGDFHENWKNKILEMDDDSTMMCDGAFGPIRLYKNPYALSHPLRMSREERIAMEKNVGNVENKTDKFMEDMMRYDLVYKGDIENGAVLVGQTVALIHDLPTCKEVIDRIMKEAIETIKEVNLKVAPGVIAQ